MINYVPATANTTLKTLVRHTAISHYNNVNVFNSMQGIPPCMGGC